jgi:hypothetical protein
MKRQHYEITIIGIAILAVAVTGGLSTFYFSSPMSLSSSGVNSSNTTHDHDGSNVAEASTFPSGSNLTRTQISQLFELFDDQPLEGGQVAPRISKWVNNDTFIFLQFDKPVAENATSLRYVGIGVKGVFCAESQPDAVNGSFTHFHQWNGSEYRHAHGSQPGDQGYWLTWAAVDNFVSFDGKEVKPGIDYEFSPTPPPNCGDNVPAVDFPVSGPEKMPKEEILQLASFFDDQPFQGGQESPRVAEWVNNNTFIFLQFDKPSPENATALNYIGIGNKGLFCKENQLSPDFTHFHKWNATEYREGHGSHANDEGYWLLWVATDEFDIQNRHVTPGVDRAFSPTPPPPSCSTQNISS